MTPNIFKNGMTHICRLCMNNSLELTDIFSSACGIAVISETIMEIAPIQITCSDDLPKFICNICIEKLKNAYSFRKLCIETNETLHQYLTEIKSEPACTELFEHIEAIEVDIKPHISSDDETTQNYTFEYDENNAKNELSPLQKEEINIENTIKEENEKYIKKKSKKVKLEKKDTIYECVKCNRSFMRKYNYKRHLLSECDKPIKKNEETSITKCQVRKKSSFQLPKVTVLPDKNGRYRCEICSKDFKNKYYLKRHNIIHTNFRFECDCGKAFTRIQHLHDHQKVHTGERSFSCEFCGKTFRLKPALTIHRNIHLGIKPYKCDICDKSFTQNKTLKNHLRTHTGERPFTCDICGRSFNRKHHLRTHNMIHTGERPFQCEVCNQSFSLKQHLNFHKVKHTGQPKPSFDCNICDRQFTIKTMLKKHLKTHSPTNE